MNSPRSQQPTTDMFPPVGPEHAVERRTATILDSMIVGYMAMDADWTITYVNGAGERIAGTSRAELVGRSFWDAFPMTVGSEFETRYRHVVASGHPVTFDAFYPEPLNIWVEVRAVPENGGLAIYFLDITARRNAQEAADRSAQRLVGLSEVTAALADANGLDDLVVIMAERGVAALGADGGAVAIPDPTDPTQLLSYITANFGEDTRVEFARLPLDAQLPVTVAASTGKPVLLGSQGACEAFSSLLQEVNTATGCQAWASIPLHADGDVIGVLTVGWIHPQGFDVEQQDLLNTFGAQCTQAMRRMAAREAERTATAQQASLVAAATALGRAETEDEVLAVIASQGTALLQASGSGLCLRDSEGTGVHFFITNNISQAFRDQLAHLPGDFSMPAVHSAVTGGPLFLSTFAETADRFPDAADLHKSANVEATASMPLRARGQLLGSLSLAFAEPREWLQSERDLLEAFATLTAQALERISAHDAERTSSAAVARFSETLQRSLLTSPPQPDHLEVAVRYLPAAADAQVGGDWYDAFITATGMTSLVIGDVTGHDRHAAAAMGQLRNLLRGIGFTVNDPPALILSALDRAAHGLDVGAMASIILAAVEQSDEHAKAGTRVLRWSNAGHLPPLLMEPGCAPRFLTSEPDLLIGVDPDAVRHDHTVVLNPGATVLLYTDGLIERRGVHLQDGMDWLRNTAAELADVSLNELCDALLEQIGDHMDDDVALLALRAYDESGPRPSEAGPEIDPLHKPTLSTEASR